MTKIEKIALFLYERKTFFGCSSEINGKHVVDSKFGFAKEFRTPSGSGKKNRILFARCKKCTIFVEKIFYAEKKKPKPLKIIFNPKLGFW